MINYEYLSELSQHYGDSFYIFSPQEINKNYSRIKEAFSQYCGDTIIAYAYKSNYEQKVCQEISKLGAWAEVCNQMEFEISQKVGCHESKTIYNGPCKSIKEINKLLLHEIIINVDSIGELEDVVHVAEQNPMLNIRIGIRLHLHTTRGSSSRFGICLSDCFINYLLEIIKGHSNISVVCLHCHTKGRRSYDWHQKVCEMIDAYNKLRSSGILIRYINLGGGLPVNDNKELMEIAKDIAESITRSCSDDGELPCVVLEPGAELVSSSLCLVSKVKRIKTIDERAFAIIHASRFHVNPMNKRRRVDCSVEKKSLGNENCREYIVAGSTCLEDDVFTNVQANLEIGDFLIFNNLGAYVLPMVPQFGFEQFAIVDYIEQE